MKHKGKAARACLRMLAVTFAGFGGLALLLGLAAQGLCDHGLATAVSVLGVWVVFALFCLWFFRDPDSRVPADAAVLVAPAHGKVDVIDDCTEPEFLAGGCRRVSIFLSVFDVHVQTAPISGRLVYRRHHAGQFLNAMRLESAAVNENVMFGFESAGVPGGRVGMRLIAGVLARRIIPWAEVGEVVERGERVSLIQFGSRVDVYLPPGVELMVKLGDRVQGGITPLARLG